MATNQLVDQRSQQVRLRYGITTEGTVKETDILVEAAPGQELLLIAPGILYRCKRKIGRKSIIFVCLDSAQDGDGGASNSRFQSAMSGARRQAPPVAMHCQASPISRFIRLAGSFFSGMGSSHIIVYIGKIIYTQQCLRPFYAGYSLRVSALIFGALSAEWSRVQQNARPQPVSASTRLLSMPKSADQKLASPVHHQHSLALGALHMHEPHDRAGHHLAYRFCVGGSFLGGADTLYIREWHQPHFVANAMIPRDSTIKASKYRQRWAEP